MESILYLPSIKKTYSVVWKLPFQLLAVDRFIIAASGKSGKVFHIAEDFLESRLKGSVDYNHML